MHATHAGDDATALSNAQSQSNSGNARSNAVGTTLAMTGTASTQTDATSQGTFGGNSTARYGSC